jgi:hypothetical protein
MILIALKMTMVHFDFECNTALIERVNSYMALIYIYYQYLAA